MIDKYLDIIQEGYLLSDKTISVDLHKFENKENNKLLIVGVCGSGKTTLAEYLAKKYKVVSIISDTDYNYMKDGLKNSKRIIIEGAQIATFYKEEPSYRKLIINQPMILIGMSAIKAGLKADKRDQTTLTGAKKWRDIYYFVRNNLSYFQKRLNLLRKDVIKLPGIVIKPFEVPKL